MKIVKLISSPLVTATITLAAFAIVIYHILTLWQPPLANYPSPLLTYPSLPQADLIFLPSIAVNLIYQHGNLVNWALSPAPSLFPDLLVTLFIALFTKNLFIILLSYSLLQIAYFVLASYIVVRVAAKSYPAGRITIIFLLFSLWLLCSTKTSPTFATFSFILSVNSHFSITTMMLTLLILFILMLHGNKRYLVVPFAILFILTASSDFLLVAHFAVPTMAALIIGRLPQTAKPQRLLLLGLLVILSIVSWFVYQQLPLFINRIDHFSIDFHLYYLTNLLVLLGNFLRHSPILSSMWLLFIISATISLIWSYRKKNHTQLITDFVIMTLLLQIIITFLVMIPINPILHSQPVNHSMRYLQPAITLPTFVGLPLLLHKHSALINRSIMKAPCYYALLLLISLSTLLMKTPPLNLQQKVNPYPATIACLDHHAKLLNLHDGIVGYANYNNINQLNRSGIRVSTVVIENQKMHANYWNCLLTDFENRHFDFVVTINPKAQHNKPPSYKPSAQKVLIAEIGEPSSAFSCGPLEVYVYKDGQINRALKPIMTK